MEFPNLGFGSYAGLPVLATVDCRKDFPEAHLISWEVGSHLLRRTRTGVWLPVRAKLKGSRERGTAENAHDPKTRCALIPRRRAIGIDDFGDLI